MGKREYVAIAGRPVRAFSANDDLKNFRAPFRLRDYFTLKDAVYLVVIAVLIGMVL